MLDNVKDLNEGHQKADSSPYLTGPDMILPKSFMKYFTFGDFYKLERPIKFSAMLKYANCQHVRRKGKSFQIGVYQVLSFVISCYF